MAKSTKEVIFDSNLQIEAYQFTGLVQKFPNHFHEYFVIGLIETGRRSLRVNHREYKIGPGDMLTFNPMDNHACEQTDSGSMSYCCINISPEVMAGIVGEVWGQGSPVHFHQPVQYRTGLASIYGELHSSIMNGTNSLKKEELFLLFMQQLLTEYTQTPDRCIYPPMKKEIEDVCIYLEQHYSEQITLDMLGQIAGLNKYTLIRTFTRLKGITPYRYLETIRISKAKLLLEQGVKPAEAAQQTGFSDQSHFTTYFNKFIGLAPGQYQSIFDEDIK